jgi:hypothetical protein
MQEYYPQDNGDAAQSNGHSPDLLYQINYLNQYLQSNPNVDFKNDYKLLTILIGANDACDKCDLFSDSHITPEQAAEEYYTNIAAAVDSIYSLIPKVIVNVLPMFNVSQVYNISQNADYCSDFHDIIPMECDCAFDSDYNKRFEPILSQLY